MADNDAEGCRQRVSGLDRTEDTKVQPYSALGDGLGAKLLRHVFKGIATTGALLALLILLGVARIPASGK
jgi:hypothetical protein